MSNGPYQNPSYTSILLNNGVTYLIQAFANATYSQCVQITPPSGAIAQFDGSGENNVPMGLTQAGFLTAGSSGSWPSFTVPGQVGSGQSKYTISVSNSNNGIGGIEPNLVGFGLPSGWQFSANIVSYEDSPNGKSPDYNDSFVIVTSWTPPVS